MRSRKYLAHHELESKFIIIIILIIVVIIITIIITIISIITIVSIDEVDMSSLPMSSSGAIRQHMMTGAAP